MLHVLTDRETLYKILEQSLDYELYDSDMFTEISTQILCEQYQKNKERIVEYMIKLRDKVKVEELRFY
jgi:hypothetical protein